MTRLSYATHNSQCTKQNMSLITNVEFNLLRSIVYHNNVLPHVASTLDHLYTLPAKGIRNTALMSVSAGTSPFTRERKGLVMQRKFDRVKRSQLPNHVLPYVCIGSTDYTAVPQFSCYESVSIMFFVVSNTSLSPVSFINDFARIPSC